MKKYNDQATLEHDAKIKGVHLVESWVKDGKLDKSNNYGLNLPEGTWVGLFKISDDKIWNNYVKEGKVKGLSIEGLFTHSLVHASKINLEKDIADLTEDEAKTLLEQIHSLILKKYEERMEANPSISSSYPGEVASGSVAPALLN
jgi:hypothetical protein